MRVTVYGEGGYDPDLPNDNIVDEYEIADPEPQPEQNDVQAIAEALAALPQVTLNALKAALGLT
jgi:hypothetical protein